MSAGYGVNHGIVISGGAVCDGRGSQALVTAG